MVALPKWLTLILRRNRIFTMQSCMRLLIDVMAQFLKILWFILMELSIITTTVLLKIRERHILLLFWKISKKVRQAVILQLFCSLQLTLTAFFPLYQYWIKSRLCFGSWWVIPASSPVLKQALWNHRQLSAVSSELLSCHSTRMCIQGFLVKRWKNTTRRFIL